MDPQPRNVRKIIQDRKLFIFDFDGVLVDSYKPLPEIYRYIGERLGLSGETLDKFINMAISMEDEEDAKGNYNKISWWPNLFSNFNIKFDEQLLHDLFKFFLEKRIELSEIIPGSVDFLKYLDDLKKIMVIVSGSDGLKGYKKRRIVSSGLDKFFREIITIEEDVRDRKESIELLLKKYKLKPSDIIVIEDKPKPINIYKKFFPEIFAIRINFKSVIQKAWQEEDKADFRIGSLRELLNMISNLNNS